MASSSSSSSPCNMIMIPPTKYDVFLSFRGEDTRNNFTSHLYSTLCRKQIQTFVDNQLIRGDEISPSLLDAIERSKISVIIFSKGYASSTWCLEELTKIIECKNKYGQIVIPIFYRIDPLDVRNQTGIFGDFFSKLEERFQGRLQKLQTWRIALKEAANLSGFDSHVSRLESELIEEIAKDILKRLSHMCESDDNGLVGAESCMKEIESLLSIGSTDVHTLGIWGIGGIGKTAIAAIFSKISKHFESSYFARNVREAEENGGLKEMQGQLFRTLLEGGNVKTRNFNFESKRLNCKKVLIVFDDVTRLKQVESLIGRLVKFAPGSRIIITSRDRQVLKNCRANEIYEMKELVYCDALKLFSQYAFEQYLLDESYMELSKKIISYAHGVPLALKVFGCFLFEKSKEVWESAISKLKTIPNVEIQEVLKISYDGLDDNEKNIFLDIVFFFVGEDRDFATKFFDACGLFPKIEMNVLVHKSLITISGNKIYVHDLLQDMGREIVRQESINDPGKRSRLCNLHDISKVLSRNKGTDQVRGISLNMSEVTKEIHLDPSTFTNMSTLRFLKFYGKENKCRVCHFQGTIFTELSYFRWDGYPLKSLPSSFHHENLVSLIMPRSNVEQLWDGVQFVNLKHIDLSESKQLRKLPDLSLAINLEILKLDRCKSLIEIHSESSTLRLNKLVFLSLKDCVSLKSLPTSIHLESLEELCLMGCSNLKSFPEISSCNIKELYLNGIAIRELPSSICCLSRLSTLCLYDCKILESLPGSLCNLKSLISLVLRGCSNLQRLPDELGNVESLKLLSASGTAIKELPSSIGCLLKLYTLDLCNCEILESLPSTFCKLKSLGILKLSGCSNLQRLPDELGNLESLKMLNLDETSIREIPSSIICLNKVEKLSFERCKINEKMGFLLLLISLPLDGLCSLRYLTLIDCGVTELPESLGQLSSLEVLRLDKNNFESISPSIINLSKLYILSISDCKRLQCLPDLPRQISAMNARGCTSLEALSGLSFLFTPQSSYQTIDLRNCLKLESVKVCQMVKDAHPNILSMAIKWRKGFNRNYYRALDGNICFPGSEVPKWFSYQGRGSSITVQLPLGWYSDNFVCFELCAIVSFQEHPDIKWGLGVCCELKHKTKGRYGNDAKHFSVGPYAGYVQSDHIVLGFFYKERLDCKSCYENEIFLQFYIKNHCREHRDYAAVKECGIHLVYKEDEAEEDKEPHLKRLKW